MIEPSGTRANDRFIPKKKLNVTAVSKTPKTAINVIPCRVIAGSAFLKLVHFDPVPT
jgi:hypothetical protein